MAIPKPSQWTSRLPSTRKHLRSKQLAQTSSRSTAEFNLSIGSTFAPDGVPRTVVGFIENPSRLADEFALLAPAAIATSDSLTVLVVASSANVQSFRPPGDTHRIIASRGGTAEAALAAVTTLGVSALALLLVSLVASASFAVLTQRRQRQLAMMSAIGATEKHLRLVMIANGTLTGLTAAITGAAVGVVGWWVTAPRIETALGFRLDRTNVPW